jgi:hypothetical protein
MSEARRITPDVTNQRDQALADLFGKVKDTSMVVNNLPSLGKFYLDFEGIKISPLKFLDEQLILNGKGIERDIVTELLEKTVEGVDVSELLLMDKTYLLMKLREVSYGDDYEFGVVCRKCNHESKSKIQLSKQLNISHIPEDFEDPRPVKLPKLGVEALVRLPRNREEHYLLDTETIYKNLYRFVVSLNDNNDPVFISQAIQMMAIADVKTIFREVTNAAYGIDPRFVFKCGKCEHKETLAVPIDSGFFSVS